MTLLSFRYPQSWRELFSLPPETAVMPLMERDQLLYVYLDALVTQIGIASAISGPTGPPGAAGATGATGATGAAGTNGVDGSGDDALLNMGYYS